MNIKIAPFTESEKSNNTTCYFTVSFLFADLVAIVVPTVVASFVIIAIMLAIIVVLKRR